jgi:hypothetical protein
MSTWLAFEISGHVVCLGVLSRGKKHIQEGDDTGRQSADDAKRKEHSAKRNAFADI